MDSFVDDTPRQERTIRRKTDDAGFLAEPRLRLKDGRARLPLGAIKGQRLTIELRRLMRPAQGIMDFDELPRRFRAVAADLETGEEVVLGGGDLALAVRASMSFPGAFPPVEVDGRVLVDGGVINNIPVSVVRELGADIVIASSFKEALGPAKELASAIAVLGRAIDIMMLDGRREQLASLGPDDVLIITDLGDIGAASFERAEDAVAPGEAAARKHFERLISLGHRGGEDTEKLVSQFKFRRIRVAYDTLDSLESPRNGALILGRYVWSPEDLGADAEFHAVNLNANIAYSYRRHALVLGQRANITIDGGLDAANLFELGGPFRLSGLTRDALSGNNALLSRAIYFYELERLGPSFLDIPLYAGASIEYGNVFEDTDDIDLDEMLVSGSLFLGADTPLGPFYLGYGVTEGGDYSIYLLIGGGF